MASKGEIFVITSAVAAATLLGAGIAAAQLTQPNGTPIPTQPGCDGGEPTGLTATFACVCVDEGVCNIGDVCPSEGNCDDGQNSTCETTMWHSFNDNTCIPSNSSGIDVYAEAAVVPETFKPTCPQTFSLLSRGTAMFRDAFGWYNVTGSAPAPSDLHVMLNCNTVPGDEVVLDLLNEPDYAGGDIGFFIITPESHSQASSCDSGDCCASVERLEDGVGYVFYSERDFNPDFAGNDSYIHLLIYGSGVWNNKFYFAWEDIYGGSNNDFTDIVTGVSGLHCAGGGQLCDTGLDGMCGRGITLCEQGELTCSQVFESSAEECNGVDDDCDGAIDDEATCPESGEICHQGSCVPPCLNNPEFPCIGNTVCDPDSSLCVHPDCVDVTCEEGQSCREGECGTPCDGIVCPHGQQCVADKCVDLCAAVSCNDGQVCVDGKCLPGCSQCDGVTCEQPLSCDAETGSCQDASCETACPEGTYCSAGECVDACDGAICPNGEACVNGQCGGTAGGGGEGGGGLPPVGGSGGSGAAAGGVGEPLADDDADGSGGCSCGAGSTRNDAAVLLLFGVPGLTSLRRRSRAPRG